MPLHLGLMSHKIKSCVSKLGSDLWPKLKKKIFCGGPCVKSINPTEKMKYDPER